MVDASHVRHKWFRTTNVALVVSIQYDCKWKIKECKSFFHKSKLKCRIQSKSIAGRQFFILAIEGTFGHSFHFFNFIYQHVHSKPQTYTHTHFIHFHSKISNCRIIYFGRKSLSFHSFSDSLSFFASVCHDFDTLVLCFMCVFGSKPAKYFTMHLQRQSFSQTRTCIYMCV